MADEKPIPPQAASFAPKPKPAPKPAKKSGVGKVAKYAGLGALGVIGAVLAKNRVMEAIGQSPEQLRQKALRDLMETQRKADADTVLAEARANSYQDSIEQNLQTVRQYSPALYMQVAAGRRLPQGAVVLGGAPRQDLLNELGRAMADGQFSR